MLDFEERNPNKSLALWRGWRIALLVLLLVVAAAILLRAWNSRDRSLRQELRGRWISGSEPRYVLQLNADGTGVFSPVARLQKGNEAGAHVEWEVRGGDLMLRRAHVDYFDDPQRYQISVDEKKGLLTLLRSGGSEGDRRVFSRS